MNEKSRILNSFRNLIYGIGFQILTTAISFVLRTTFIYVLGVEYLGINGLFANILTVLSLGELGIGNIVVYSLYKPLAQNDKIKIAALMNFYKRIYNYIAIFMTVAGICIIPFLKLLIKSEIQYKYIIIYYCLFLANTVASYLFVYKISIINADQKQYLTSRYNFIFKIIVSVLQIIILITTKNYIVYLTIEVVFTFLNNLYISKKVNKLYPYILEKYNIEKSERSKIFSDVKSMFSYKIGGILLNSTDNIYISALQGTALIGYCSNYLLVISVVNTFINIIYNSIYNSIGNLNATDNHKRKKEVFDVTVLLYSWIAGMGAVGLYLLIKDFIILWIGNKYLLPNNIVAILVLNFYLPIILYPIWSFRNTTGLFKETKHILTITAVINLILSYFGGIKYGLFGILASTAISRLCTSFWYEPYILYKKRFKTSSREYFCKQLFNLFIILISVLVSNFALKSFNEVNVVNFIIKLIIVVFTYNVVFFCIYFKSKELKYVYKNIIIKFKVRLKHNK